MKTNTKIVFFPGPDKTATTWFYRQFSHHPDIHVLGGKEDLRYLKKNDIKKINKKIIAIFDHEAPFRGLLVEEKIKALSPIAFILLRDPIQRSISALKNDLRMGVISASEIKTILKRKNKYLERSNYDLYINFAKKTCRNIKLFQIEDLQNKEDLFIKKICQYLDIDPRYFEKNLIINNSREPRNIYLNSLIKSFIKPIFYILGLGKKWHFLYHSKISFLFFPKNGNKTEDLIDYFRKDDLSNLSKNYQAIKQKYKNFM